MTASDGMLAARMVPMIGISALGSPPAPRRRGRPGPTPAKCLLASFMLALVVARPGTAAEIERLEPGRSDVAIFAINGQFILGETMSLQREISLLPSNMPVAVVLNSPGGKLAEGIKLGTFFHQAKIPTFVMGFGGYCNSACSLAFLGGRDRTTGKPSRFKMTTGRLGFHQFSPTPSEEELKKVYKKADMDAQAQAARLNTFLIIRYLKEIGEDMSKLHLMLVAPAEGIRLVSNEEAVALGIHVMGEDAGDFIEASRILERVKAP